MTPREPTPELAARRADEVADAVLSEVVEHYALNRDHRHSRWHDESSSVHHHESWACVPLTDVIDAVRAAAYNASLR